MTPPADTDLYRRGMKTALAAWEEYASGTADAEVRRSPGVAAAIFPSRPERDVYNNAILERDLPGPDRADAVAAMETAYDARGVTRFAAWVHETDEPLRSDLERRGYTVDETTRAMGMALTDILVPRPALDLGSAGWDDFVRIFGLPEGLLGGADHSAFHLLVRPVRRTNASPPRRLSTTKATAASTTSRRFEHARRRGLGTALTAVQLHDAAARGCRTASVQSTEMAERVYAAVGFRDLGLIFEYVPQNPRHPRSTREPGFLHSYLRRRHRRRPERALGTAPRLQRRVDRLPRCPRPVVSDCAMRKERWSRASTASPGVATPTSRCSGSRSRCAARDSAGRCSKRRRRRPGSAAAAPSSFRRTSSRHQVSTRTSATTRSGRPRTPPLSTGSSTSRSVSLQPGSSQLVVAAVEGIRDARPDEASALEALQRRSSDVWEEYRAQLAAHPDAIAPPHHAIAEGRVRVAADEQAPSRLLAGTADRGRQMRARRPLRRARPDATGRRSTARRRPCDARRRCGRKPCRRDRKPQRPGLLRAGWLRDHRSRIDSFRRCSADEPRTEVVEPSTSGRPLRASARTPRRRPRVG